MQGNNWLLDLSENNEMQFEWIITEELVKVILSSYHNNARKLIVSMDIYMWDSQIFNYHK